MEALRSFAPLVLLALPVSLHAQPDIRVNVDLAQIEVVVADSSGRHVPGLTAADFRLSVDGKDRRITALSFIDPGSEPVAAAGGLLRREDVRRAVVFMIDEVHTAPENLARLAPVVRRFVDEQMGPRDLVSVMATRNNLGFFERFTSDKQQVRAALERVVRLVGQSYDHISDQNEWQYDRAGMVKMGSAFMMEAYHGLAMNAIERALAGLRDMPGRKAVVLMSDGIEFPLDQLNPRIGQHADPDFVFRMKRRTRQVAELAAQSGVVFYTFDAKTLDPPGSLDPVRRASLQSIPYLLAQETGGLFVHETNALSDALGKAMEDMAGYYLIGFPPTDEERRKGSALENHRIRVRVARPGLTARTQSAIRFRTSAAAAAAPAVTREEAMRRAILSPFTAGDVRLRLTPVYSAGPAEGKNGQRPTLLRVLLSIDGRDVTWPPGENGRRAAILDVAVVAFASDNSVVGNKDQRHTVDVTEAQAARLAAVGMEYWLDLGALRPGPYQIRAAVRDAVTGATGSAGAFLDLPNFNQRRLAVSSLVLEDNAGAPQATRVASRRFAPGTRIHYGCQVYGARVEDGLPKVDVEVRLFRDRARVFASQPIPLFPQAGESEITVVGSFALPSSLPEGEYTVQLVAYDRLTGSKPATASQSTDLTLRTR